MHNATPLSSELLTRFSRDFSGDEHLRALELMMSRSGLYDAAYDPREAARVPFQFSVELPTTGVTDQKQSGRCWLFASMNMMREKVIQKCRLEKFELSGNWLGFWDKLEKCNFFLECILDSAALPVDSREVNWLLNGGISDGGQWDMMVSVVKKYGVVPASVMPETAQSCKTRELILLLNTRLRKCALELRALAAAGGDTRGAKEEMMRGIYNALVICFGRPPETFDFEYTDKDKNYHIVRGLNGRSFYEQFVGVDLDEYISIINAPTADKPFGRTYTVRYLGNVVGGSVLYLNLEMDELKRMAVRQLQDGKPVWFGSDCSKCGDRSTALWDPASLDYTAVLGGMDFSMTKAQRLEMADSIPNHAMLICGVNLDENGNPNRWKIQNSWGEAGPNKGYFVASDAWFEQFVYQVILNRSYLTEDRREMLKQPPVVLDPWDPMGTLA